MAVPVVYALAAATQVPPLITGASQPLLKRTDGAPTTGPTLSHGDTDRLAVQFGNLSETTDILGRFGGGAYGIPVGVELSASGADLTLNVSAGTAMLDGPVPVAAQTVAITAGGYAWLWVTQAGAIVAVTGSNPNAVPAAPSVICAFLGRIDATSGVISSIDYSGRPFLRGGVLWRQTGDLQAPGDSPPPTLQFFHRTSGGLWVWDGQGYALINNAVAAVASITFSTILQAVQEVTDRQDAILTLLRQVVVWVATIDDEVPPALQEEWVLGLEDTDDEPATAPA